MKKLVLTCVLAAGWSNLALAQGITLYGILDAGVGYSRQAGSRSDITIDSGSSDDSRIGLRGSEELRAGLKANFVLESGVDLDTGTSTEEEKFYNRDAWIGLEGGFGELRLGRHPTFTYDWFTDLSPFGNDYRQASTETVFGYEAIGSRVDNSVFFFSPRFGGVEAGIGYSFNDDGPEAAEENNRVVSLGLRYERGPVTAVASYEVRRDADEDAGPGRADVRNLSVGATYEFSRVKLHAGYGRLKNREFSEAARTEKAWMIGTSVQLGSGQLLAAYQRVSNRNLNEFGIDARRDGFAVAYEHSLSKRTTLYVYGSRFRAADVRSDDESRLAARVEFGSGVRFMF